MQSLRRRLIVAALGATLAFGGATLAAAPASAASAEVNYSPLYWQLLDRYASVEATWAPVHGVYPGDPEALLAPQQPKEPGGSVTILSLVILNPDGTLGPNGWIPDPAAPNGWRAMASSDCTYDKLDDLNYWLCWL